MRFTQLVVVILRNDESVKLEQLEKERTNTDVD